MVSYANDERCVALAKVLEPLLERSGPDLALPIAATTAAAERLSLPASGESDPYPIAG
ncbi:hypothetical protein [Streptomyces sp. NPDC048191]|uniref:hypothetical protein n=1 Tax=Streptomyces sp. NPDC048191 TaxID=3155484 RepID=UPI0033DBC0AD